MLPYLVAILPPAPIAKKVNELKQWVIERCGILEESLSIAHITLNLNRFPNIELVDKALSECCATFPPIEIAVEGLNTFPGQTTVAYAYIMPNPALQQLQERIANALAPLHDGEHLREYLTPKRYIFTTGQILASEKYGYPYIGHGWQPHMTIAFFDDKNFQKAGKELLTKPIEGKFTVHEITLLSLQQADGTWQWKPFRVYPLGTKSQ